jgi:rubredoxin
MTYVCSACGFVYDESAEECTWDNLDEDYECPLCGVGKEQFSAG